MDTIGLDLHKRESQLCIGRDDGSVEERRIVTSRERFTAVLGNRPPARVLVEASTESEWVARHLEGLGHDGDRGRSELRAHVCDAVAADEDRSARCANADGSVSARRVSAGVSPVGRTAARARGARRARGVRADAHAVHRVGEGAGAPRRACGWPRARRTSWPSGSRRWRCQTCSARNSCRSSRCWRRSTNRSRRRIDGLRRSHERIPRWRCSRRRRRSVRLRQVPSWPPLTTSHAFASAHHFEAFLGLVPGERSSGEKRRDRSDHESGQCAGAVSLGRSRAGGSCARRIRRPRHCASGDFEIADRRGKRIAVVAIARRLAGILYAMWRDQQTYDSTKLRAGAGAR